MAAASPSAFGKGNGDTMPTPAHAGKGNGDGENGGEGNKGKGKWLAIKGKLQAKGKDISAFMGKFFSKGKPTPTGKTNESTAVANGESIPVHEPNGSEGGKGLVKEEEPRYIVILPFSMEFPTWIVSNYFQFSCFTIPSQPSAI